MLAVLPEGDRVIGPPISKSSKDATWRIAIDVQLRTNELESRLHAQAREKDELSLLSGISEKDRQRLHSKGIFTVTQLSYSFRPRRRRRESRGKQEKHHHSLRALAIRENKIHAVGIPDLTLKGTPVFLDVEGLPDRNFYYLIGIRIQTAEGSAQRSFWAHDAKEEKLIWNDFLGVLSEITNPHLIHYGTYETTFLKRMCDRPDAHLQVRKSPPQSIMRETFFRSFMRRSISRRTPMG